MNWTEILNIYKKALRFKKADKEQNFAMIPVIWIQILRSLILTVIVLCQH